MGGWKHFNIMQEKHKKFSIYKYRSLEVNLEQLILWKIMVLNDTLVLLV